MNARWCKKFNIRYLTDNHNYNWYVNLDFRLTLKDGRSIFLTTPLQKIIILKFIHRICLRTCSTEKNQNWAQDTNIKLYFCFRWSLTTLSEKTQIIHSDTAAKKPTWRKIKILALFRVSFCSIFSILYIFIFHLTWYILLTWMTRNSQRIIISTEKSVIINISNISDDFNRVVLEPEADIADSDYINASYVDVSR